MKIFQNKSCLSLQIRDEFPHFRFETASLEEVKAALEKKELDFEGQVFYCKAKKKETFPKEIFDFLTTSGFGEVRCQLTLLFRNQMDRQNFHFKFKEFFGEVIAAGGVPVNAAKEYLLIFRHGVWDLAKGKLDPGESIRECAWREMQEETGLQSHKISRRLEPTYHIFLSKYGQNWKFKTTHWFLMPTKKKEKLKPQKQEGITDVKWFSHKKLVKKMPDTYPLVEEVLREAMYGKV